MGEERGLMSHSVRPSIIEIYRNMASALKNLSAYNEENVPSAEYMKFAIVVADWNKEITHALYEACVETLTKHGAREENIYTAQVPGAFELPLGARLIYGAKLPDAVICLGCVVKGETTHNEYINDSVATGLTNLSLTIGKPFIFGLLTPNDYQQALDRAGGKHGNKGVEGAITAIRMVALDQKIGASKAKIGF